MKSVKYPKEVIDSLYNEIEGLKNIVESSTSENLLLQSKLERRNTQIADLKHRLEQASDLINEACDIVCPNDCKNCLWASHCNSRQK